MSLLEIADLSKAFGGLLAVDRVGFCVEPGQIGAVVGPNGAGKTTIFNLISGVLRPDKGEISFRGENLTGLAPHVIATRGVIRTFQNVRLFPNMNVLENVMLGRYRWGRASLLEAALRVGRGRKDEQEAEQRAMECLKWVGLEQRAYEQPQGLPYGQQRLLEIARGLASVPDLLLLDEPAAGLNESETNYLMELLGRIRDAGVTILLIEHNMRLVMQVSEQIVVVNYGRKIAEGSPADIQCNEEVMAAYLGKPSGISTTNFGMPE